MVLDLSIKKSRNQLLGGRLDFLFPGRRKGRHKEEQAPCLPGFGMRIIQQSRKILGLSGRGPDLVSSTVGGLPDIFGRGRLEQPTAFGAEGERERWYGKSM